jgi:ribosomal protein L17
MSPKAARRYFDRMATASHDRAAAARRTALTEADPTIKQTLEALAQQCDQKAASYALRRDGVR